MTETTNLKLPIYSDSDVPDWMNTNDGFEALDSLVNSCAMVQLDWGNPIHSFENIGTWTATEDCYLCGVSRNSAGTLFINNSPLITTGANEVATLPPTRIRKGDVVSNSGVTSIYAYRGTLISGNTYVFNEAQVTLDYAHPLHTFSSGNLSYTATEKCWLVGCFYKEDTYITLSINSVEYSTTSSSGNGTRPLSQMFLPLSKGDVVTLSGAPTNGLHVLRGTVTGSVANVGEPIFDFANPLHTFTNNALTYTTTKECWLVGTFGMSNTGNGELFINNTRVAHTRWYAENCTCEIKYRLAPNTEIKIIATAAIDQTLYVLDTI